MKIIVHIAFVLSLLGVITGCKDFSKKSNKEELLSLTPLPACIVTPEESHEKKLRKIWKEIESEQLHIFPNCNLQDEFVVVTFIEKLPDKRCSNACVIWNTVIDGKALITNVFILENIASDDDIRKAFKKIVSAQ